MPNPNKPSNSQDVPKPYDFVTFPSKPPTLKSPAGHHKYLNQRIHGTIYLELIAGTSVHVSTGTVMMGSDVGQSRIPLIKTMMQSGNQLSISGSSLKGVVRSIYEAITNSTLGVVTGRYRNRMPPDRLPPRQKDKLCPASRVFGALDWQGLINFRDAKCIETKFVPGFMPSLYRPRPDQYERYFNPVSRKFYHHAVKAVSAGDRGIPVQKANPQYTFLTQLHLKNLTQAELGALMIALGQDQKYPFGLKVGAGKPIGMGTMMVKVIAMDKPDSMRDRYSSYTEETPRLEGAELQQFIESAIASAHTQELIELPQLKQLQQILQYPTERNAPDGTY